MDLTTFLLREATIPVSSSLSVFSLILSSRESESRRLGDRNRTQRELGEGEVTARRSSLQNPSAAWRATTPCAEVNWSWSHRAGEGDRASVWMLV